MRPDHPMPCATAPQRNSRHWKQGQVTWKDLLGWMRKPGKKKESGNYLLGTLRRTTKTHPGGAGPCTDLHRDKTAIVSRSALTLDIDHPAPGFADKVALTLPWAALLHTTFSSAPDALRYRIIIPIDREVDPEEYHALANLVMEQMGREQFDPTSDQPSRYMFRPAAQHEGWYDWQEVEGDPLPVDDVLAAWDPAAMADRPMPKPSRTKRDPYDLPGTVGVFNRTYEDLADLIEAYDLPYEEAGADRWHLVGARSVAGMGPVQGTAGLYYSHHVNDPAHGVTCSAFDLVRLHLFGDLDEDAKPGTPVNKMPSHEAMLKRAVEDPRVKATIMKERTDSARDAFDAIADEEDFGGIGASVDWKLGLTLDRNGVLVDSIANWDHLRRHDPVFRGLYYNELTMAIESEADLPWRPLERGGSVFGNTDRVALGHYLEREFGIQPAPGRLNGMVDTAAQQKYVNPVRDYLEALRWDGVSRIETCLPGVTPTDFTRTVARKALVAAAARMLQPGIKWDHTLVLYGDEGLGKSWWVDRMARGWSSSLGRVNDKDTLITMQRSWIMTADEGYSLRKADADVLKDFLTRTHDVFRLPYEREALVHPRHCVIWSTTNDEVFLRRQEGNRRFLIVHCAERVDFDLFTEDYVDQVWAEAVHLFRNGERLFLEDTEAELAREERERFTEEDALAGVIQEYLDTLVPDDWEERSPESRQEWLAHRAEGLVPLGTEPINEVCTIQIWVEALGQERGRHRRSDLLEINAALKHLPGWQQEQGRRRVPGYGPQVVFRRLPDEDLL